MRNPLRIILIAGILTTLTTRADADLSLTLEPGDHVVLIGNTLAERMQHFGYFEALLHARFPAHELVVRNLGWSADELTLRPRSKDFNDHGHTLEDHKADVILAFFGFNESFAGPLGIEKFERDLENFITRTRAARYNGRSEPRLALVSPIAHEDLRRAGLTDGKANNQNLRLYAEAMGRAARRHGVVFVDLFVPTSKMMRRQTDLTINGIHLNDEGYRHLAPLLMNGLFGGGPSKDATHLDLRAEVLRKNQLFWYDHRAVNGYYIYGGRKEPFGVVNFPAEFRSLRQVIAHRDRLIWAAAQRKDPTEISGFNDKSLTPSFETTKTNIDFEVAITPPGEAIKSFSLAEGYSINLYASEVEFPELRNPSQFAFDARGRLWVCTMQSYPMYLPGKSVNDKILIFEDIDGDGKADKQSVFAEGLYVPTGIELGDGGVYLAQQPNLMFLEDTNGDDRADTREIILGGFDTADSHHSISAFTWGPGGALYFQEGTFHHTQVETPYGPVRCKDAGVFRYEPKTEKLDVFVSYGFANPWGHVFHRWGQNFVADASGGQNYFGAAFSGQVDYPHKHGKLQHFLEKQWRPTSGCELVANRHFPEVAQGNYLLNNIIGFQGVLQYRMAEKESGFFAEPVEPLLQSSDRNFRPVDLQFGLDGALYIIDWFNPLIGHMQHSLRDPNRDKSHGRIWRITHKNRPLVKPPKISGQPIPVLLDLLKSYEDRTRYHVRRELRLHDTAKVIEELGRWVKNLDPKDPNHAHHLLEALWVHQQHDMVDAGLLAKLLRSPDYRVRAAATRVLCYWRDRIDRPLERLRTQINDKHPRVRLEALRALSFFDSNKALEIAVESLVHPQDAYLEYTLKETMATLERRIGSRSPRDSKTP